MISRNERQGKPYPKAMSGTLFGYEQILSEQSFIAKSNLSRSSGGLRPSVSVQLKGKF